MELSERQRKRNRRMSFSCSQELWESIEERTDNVISNSLFIRQAIEEKLNKMS